MIEQPQLIPQTRWVLDRGPRPRARGWYHLVAALLASMSGAVLITYAWMTLNPLPAFGVTVYAIGLVQMFGVSAAYHCGPWRSARTVALWRWADHSTIALFIAATYTPMALLKMSPSISGWLLCAVWGGAAFSVALSLFPHPRWLDVVVYLGLGWLSVPIIPELWRHAGPSVVWLLLAGGLVYSFGALLYAVRWPGRHARWIGYHEHFHLATIIAGVLHLIAVWIVVVQGAA
ncbi:hemolysin III family protein [Corynebacterium sp.]|uniref:PAQR family membrane homeostasis protein TrhA n=1 Tax=Corynebacterium sp. TaxID=1720 RepID=UPI0026DBFA2E|nr:hemolysin III family protein [Corynebacterium sp.]MDO5076964.1 hemolysin III family protein [Corynebacterium sp.]